jgi:flavin reductase (DIM6/NTAB) family NADH-FMN oxidoreductase RutF
MPRPAPSRPADGGPQYAPLIPASRRQDLTETIPMSEFAPDTFRKACGYWATGVSIVTTRDTDGKAYGLTMNGLTSLSLDPPLFIICVDNKSDTLEPMKRSGAFCINVLSAGQQELSNRFAKKGPDKFEGVEHQSGPTGSPRLAGYLLGIECKVKEVHPGGDHHIFVGEVVSLDLPTSEDLQPLLYYRGKYALVAG